MNEKQTTSQLISIARQALKSARSVPELKQARQLAEGARNVARSLKVPQKMLFDAACLALRAEHQMGTALSRIDLAKGAPGNQYTGRIRTGRTAKGKQPVYLRDLGISPMDSARSQQLATLTANQLERWLAKQFKAGIEPTFAAARRFAKEKERARTKRK